MVQDTEQFPYNAVRKKHASRIKYKAVSMLLEVNGKKFTNTPNCYAENYAANKTCKHAHNYS